MVISHERRSWPPTPTIWWPNSNFSGQRKEKLVAKIHGKKVKTNILSMI
jgi:hypothetical protein